MLWHLITTAYLYLRQGFIDPRGHTTQFVITYIVLAIILYDVVTTIADVIKVRRASDADAYKLTSTEWFRSQSNIGAVQKDVSDLKWSRNVANETIIPSQKLILDGQLSIIKAVLELKKLFQLDAQGRLKVILVPDGDNWTTTEAQPQAEAAAPDGWGHAIEGDNSTEAVLNELDGVLKHDSHEVVMDQFYKEKTGIEVAAIDEPIPPQPTMEPAPEDAGQGQPADQPVDEFHADLEAAAANTQSIEEEIAGYQDTILKQQIEIEGLRKELAKAKRKRSKK